jgi:hypothetical protein
LKDCDPEEMKSREPSEASVLLHSLLGADKQQDDRAGDISHGDLRKIAANSITGLDEGGPNPGDCCRVTGLSEVIHMPD